MLERVLLAVGVTFCIYLFLNLGGKSSKSQPLNTRIGLIPEVIHQVAFF